ncbi:MAG: cytochrome c5 family protein [Ferrovum sp.]|nr:cytochrome c5 family protein [Ferrovum sp.]
MKSTHLIISVALVGSTTLLAVPTASYAADGKETFEKVCKMCHGTGLGGAPKFGDKVAWAPRIAKGLETLQDHALHGFKGKGIMPPKGGRASLSDDDVKAAVAYMVEAGK